MVVSEDGKLLGLTEIGAFHVCRLRLNRAALVEHRMERLLLEAERAAYEATLARLDRLEDQVTSLRIQLQILRVLPPDDLP
jgi:hypothetical protein